MTSTKTSSQGAEAAYHLYIVTLCHNLGSFEAGEDSWQVIDLLREYFQVKIVGSGESRERALDLDDSTDCPPPVSKGAGSCESLAASRWVHPLGKRIYYTPQQLECSLSRDTQ